MTDNMPAGAEHAWEKKSQEDSKFEEWLEENREELEIEHLMLVSDGKCDKTFMQWAEEKYQNIAEALSGTVEKIARFIENHPKIGSENAREIAQAIRDMRV